MALIYLAIAESLSKRQVTVESQNATLTVPYGSTSTSTSNASSSNSGLSVSDKIALGTGIGIGVPAVLFGLIGAYYTWKTYRRRHSGASQSVGVSKTIAGSNSVIANGDMKGSANAATTNYENLVHESQGFSDQTPEIGSRPARSWVAELATTAR